MSLAVTMPTSRLQLTAVKMQIWL